MQKCLCLVSFFSRSDCCSQKSSCLLRSHAMQQFSFSTGHTEMHFARIPWTLKPHSTSICWRPLAMPVSVVIFCALLWNLGQGLFIRIMVSFCLRCFPPFDQFISKARSASGPSEACADDWSNTNSATQSGCASSKIAIALLTCTRSCAWSHHGSPPTSR